MSAEEKARELVDKYLYHVEALSVQGQLDNAKMCALIAVTEVLNNSTTNYHEAWWQEVKQEINLLS